MQAIAHGTAFVAEISMGANDVHALKTILEAEAFPDHLSLLHIPIVLRRGMICAMDSTSKRPRLNRVTGHYSVTIH
ncbi:MAG: hypothetical protein ABIN94_15220 [Ferruginibacter sp.]